MSCAQANSSDERISELMRLDIYDTLEELVVEREELKQNKIELSKIDQRIKKTKKGQNVYIQFKNVAGTVLLIGVVIGSYKAYFPPGLRAMLSAYLTLHGYHAGMIKLSSGDIAALSKEMQKINSLINTRQSQIRQSFDFYCAQDASHPVCCTNY